MNPLLNQLDLFEKMVKSIAGERDASRTCCDDLRKELSAAYVRIAELERQVPLQPTCDEVSERMLALTEPAVFGGAYYTGNPVTIPAILEREAVDVQ